LPLACAAMWPEQSGWSLGWSGLFKMVGRVELRVEAFRAHDDHDLVRQAPPARVGDQSGIARGLPLVVSA
jgi:hypothetical protein